MLTIPQGLEAGAKLLRGAISSIESNVNRALKERVDEKTLSVISRLRELLESLSDALESVAKSISSADQEIIVLSQYTYAFRADSEVVLMRGRPEYIAIAYNASDNTISLKARNKKLTLSQNFMAVHSRGLSIVINAYSVDQVSEKVDELRAALKAIESTVYRRLLPLIERRVIKKRF